MFDPKALLDQMFGAADGEQASTTRAAGAQPGFGGLPGAGSFAGGAAVGGLLGLVLGNKKMRKLAGGTLGYGGAAVLGALAHRAYQSYQAGEAPAPLSASGPVPAAAALPHDAPAADGAPFELVLVSAMIGAAKADGHIDADERRHLFAEVERMDLDGEAKAFVFDALSQETDLGRLAAAVNGEEQAAELYLASRLAIDPDDPAERAYLDALAGRLRLPAALREQLDNQVEA